MIGFESTRHTEARRRVARAPPAPPEVARGAMSVLVMLISDLAEEMDPVLACK
jgi:hypothetical protein